jgi:hypothetical protein
MKIEERTLQELQINARAEGRKKEKKKNSWIRKGEKTAESKRQNRRSVISAEIYMIMQNRIRNRIPLRVNIR